MYKTCINTEFCRLVLGESRANMFYCYFVFNLNTGSNCWNPKNFIARLIKQTLQRSLWDTFITILSGNDDRECVNVLLLRSLWDTAFSSRHYLEGEFLPNNPPTSDLCTLPLSCTAMNAVTSPSPPSLFGLQD